MKYFVDNLFPTPIFNSFIDPISDETKSEILNLEFEKDKTGFSLSVNNFVLEMEKFSFLKHQVLKNVEIFTREVLCVDPAIEFYLMNSWVILQEEDQSTYLHSHSNSILSGALYIETDEDSGEIVFEKPYMYNNVFPYSMNFKFTKYNEINTQLFKYSPKNNQILIFPSHLKHRVDPNRSLQKRVALSFNLMVRGDFSYSRINELYLK